MIEERRNIDLKFKEHFENEWRNITKMFQEYYESKKEKCESKEGITEEITVEEMYKEFDKNGTQYIVENGNAKEAKSRIKEID